jgi:hypothetical protein
LQYLADVVNKRGDLAIYVDMRTLGSDSSIYADENVPLAERATKLLIDVLNHVHEALVGLCVHHSEDYDLSRTGPLLDKVAQAISQISVVGTLETEARHSAARRLVRDVGVQMSAATQQLGFDLGASENATSERVAETRRTLRGRERYTIHFGTLNHALSSLVHALQGRRVWLLLDEWSVIPLDLQPYLADILRRTVFPIGDITVKIAAIEHRSRFQEERSAGGYLGIELGADAQANMNLDDFMVFDNDQRRAKEFFRELLFKHFRADGPQTPKELIKEAFTQTTAFEEFVRAVEGVPRDAINIAEMAAQRAYAGSISVNHVRTAARDWYQRDKAPTIQSEDRAVRLLAHIIDEVIGHRRARAFLIRSDRRHKMVDRLFDARLLHILKRSVSAHDQPGIRYAVFKLDYGCYVDLINTKKAPLGLLPGGEEDRDGDNGDPRFVDVPPDDYRSIRRAILQLDEFSGDYSWRGSGVTTNHQSDRPPT